MARLSYLPRFEGVVVSAHGMLDSREGSQAP